MLTKVINLSGGFKLVKLELMEKEDLKKIIEWNTNKSADYLLQWSGPKFIYPLTLDQLEDYFTNEVKIDNSNINVYKIILEDTEEIIGTVELSIRDKDTKEGRVGRFLIGQEKSRGKGIGTEVLSELLKIGFIGLGLEKITLGVFDFNLGAIKCYEKAGFVKERLIENARKSENGYWNLYEMYISKTKWLQKQC